MNNLAEMIVGTSSAMVRLRDYLPKVARSPATVLITGATGTGKDRVAHTLHELGPRVAGRRLWPSTVLPYPMV